MHCLLFNNGTKLRTKCLFGHQIYWTTEQVFGVKLDAEIALRRCQAVERDQDVDVAIALCHITRGGTKQGQTRDAEALGQCGFAVRQNFQCRGAFYCSLHSQTNNVCVFTCCCNCFSDSPIELTRFACIASCCRGQYCHVYPPNCTVLFISRWPHIRLCAARA